MCRSVYITDYHVTEYCHQSSLLILVNGVGVGKLQRFIQLIDD